MCYKCNDCGAIFEHPFTKSNLDQEEYKCCPECNSEDYSAYDEGQEAYDSTQR